jgi:hypothetical protein
MERVVLRVNSTLAAFASGIAMTGDIRVDMMALLTHYGCEKTISHSLCIANEAQRLAARWNESLFEAEVAGWLHDISGIGCHTTLRADATGLDKVVFRTVGCGKLRRSGTGRSQDGRDLTKRRQRLLSHRQEG